MHSTKKANGEYEQALQQARVSLLNSTFDQFWVHSERSSLIDNGKYSSSTVTLKSQPSWRHHLKSQRSIILLILIVIPLLLFSLPFLILSQYRADRLLHQCSSLACISASQRIIENFDLTEDPCNNFYRYACGGWMKKHFLTPSETSLSYFKEIYRKNLIILYKLLQETSPTSHFQASGKLKIYFHACLNASNDESNARDTLLGILDHSSKSPLLFPNWSHDDFDLVSSLIYAHRHQIHPLFQMGVAIDERNNRHHRISFQRAGLSFNEQLRYHDSHLRQLFNQFGTRLIEYLHSPVTHREILRQIDEIFQFESRLASIFSIRRSHNPSRLYHPQTYRQLQQWFSPWLDIERYLQEVFHKDQFYFSNQTFLITHSKYFQHLSRLIQTTPKSILANYITFQIIQELVPYMPKSFAQIRRPLDAYLKGVTEEKPLWQVCVRRADEAFGFATGALFVLKVFDEQKRERIEHLVEEIRLAFVETLSDLHWMDSKTRQQVQRKAQLMINRLGYPKWLKNESSVDHFYKDLLLSETNSPIINRLLVQRFHKERNWRKLDQEPDREEWTITPVDVNAYYTPWRNMMVFPAGILQTPFFDPNIPIPLNFGSIASIIGHELIHAFDASGRYFDGYGNLHDWWQQESARRFDNHAQCFIDQYAQYHVGRRQINGFLTLDENIADNGGLRLAFAAYQRYSKRHRRLTTNYFQRHQQQQLLPGLNLTDEQLFFVGFAQTWCAKATPEYAQAALVTDRHALPEYRVIGSLSNMPEFSQTFSCRKGSPMNPRKRCQLWSSSNSKR